jgi:uncharacterized damage-inducible protein DinB
MDPHRHFQTLARYNAWATKALLTALECVPEGDYRRDCGLFFKSIHGTLNHLLLGEHRLWRVRFQGGVPQIASLTQEVESDRAALASGLLLEAQAWMPMIAAWDASRFDGLLQYTSLRGSAQSLPFAATLAHVFNHSTHHRGQITAALTAMGQPAPEIDMVYMLQAQAQAQANSTH